MNETLLDLDAVQAFVRVVDTGSFTQAAQSLQSSQAAISMKVKRLEDSLQCRLLERTPRYVNLSTKGSAFLPLARQLLQANSHAISTFTEARQRLVIGISDHVAGPELPELIARMNTLDTELQTSIRIGSSGDLLDSYDRRELDAVLVRLHVDRTDGVVIAEEQFGWFAAPHLQLRTGEPLPIATLAEPCGVRVLSGALLDNAGIDWAEVFVGGGVTAISAAVMAGVGIAALAPRMLPLGVVNVGEKLALPALPRLPIVLYSRIKTAPGQRMVHALCAMFKAGAHS